MKEVSRQPRGSAIWIGLALVVVMLGGIAWIALAYLKGNRPVEVPVSREAIESITGPQPRQETTTAEHDWKINSWPYLMAIHQPDNSTSYEYQFSVLSTSAFTGKDLRLMILARNLATNSVLAREAGASEDQVKQISASLGDRLTREPLRVSDDAAKSCKSLWEKYIATRKAKDRETIHDELVQAIHDACTASRQASEPDFAATLADVRRLIPQEQQYEDNITAARNKKASEYFTGGQQTASDRHIPASTQPGSTTQASTRP